MSALMASALAFEAESLSRRRAELVWAESTARARAEFAAREAGYQAAEASAAAAMREAGEWVLVGPRLKAAQRARRLRGVSLDSGCALGLRGCLEGSREDVPASAFVGRVGKAAGQRRRPDSWPGLSQADREARTAEKAAAVITRRVRKEDMVCLRLLLGCLVRETPFVLAEVNGENWVPARWMHWIFPCDIGDSYGLEHRVTLLSADAFLDANPTWWREILERIVGRAERTIAGFTGLFSPDHLRRIDAFGTMFAQVPRRIAWFTRLLRRVRILRGLGAGATPDLLLVPDEHHAGKRMRELRAGRSVVLAPDWSPFSLPMVLGDGPAGAGATPSADVVAQPLLNDAADALDPCGVGVPGEEPQGGSAAASPGA